MTPSENGSSIWKQRTKDGFITIHSDRHNKTQYELAPDFIGKWEQLRQKLGPEWKWYSEEHREIEYNFDRYGFRNNTSPDDLEDGYILLTGQSIIECIGLPWEDTVAGKLERATGKQVYQVSTTGIDSLTILSNTINALRVLPRPSHIFTVPTSPAAAFITLDYANDMLVNMTPAYGNLKLHLAAEHGVDLDWMTRHVDLTDILCERTGYYNQLYRQSIKIQEDICSVLGIKCTMLDMESDRPEFFDQTVPEVYTDGDWIRGTHFIPIRANMDKLMNMQELVTQDHINELSMEWINTRARDLVHMGEGHCQVLVDEMMKHIELP